MIQNVLVLGAGSAGLFAALTLKKKIPSLGVRVVRSAALGVIGVGESTTPNLPKHLFEYMGISHRQFYALVHPTWKMGIHFIWGPREAFDYGFAQQMDAQWSDLPRPNGFYCDEDFSFADLNSSLMALGKAFPRQPQGGGPHIPDWHAFHLDNPKLVKGLEVIASEAGIEFIDANMKGAERGPAGLSAIVLEDGRKLEADFFVDASGFRSELLGRTLAEPFVSFDRSLFCDRAVVGSWERTDEPILPYTIAETMDAGWCWQIEHEDAVNRGYVFSSGSLSDDHAHAEFMRKNPKAKTWDHVVKFRSGRYQRLWIDNVLAVGNSGGFVEPLEATALMVVCWQCRTFVDFLLHSGAAPPPSLRELYNRKATETWDEIRDFLSIHYRFNTRLDTPFWQKCRAEVDVSRVAPLLDFYRENGPTGFCRHFLGTTGSQFGVEGFLVQLVGNRVPYEKRYVPTEAEWATWNRHRQDNKTQAAAGMDVKEALSYIKHPNWRWHAEARG
ncbi:MAG TPA: tryptophan 7-halogenase [Tepidisphaeraceae bacterium]|jgi:tryptophan halogenase